MSMQVSPLPGATFGGLLHVKADAVAFADLAEREPDVLPHLLNTHQGLLLIKGMNSINNSPNTLLRLSRLFGEEVENYHETRMAHQNVHTKIPEIFLVSNIPPANRLPPPLPNPSLTRDGKLPTQFPHRRGWHTDQSYRRPPPDVSLFYCVIPAPKDQAQTLFANGVGAYLALSEKMKRTVENLIGIHSKPGIGRSEYAALSGELPKILNPADQPQIQPVARTHPITGAKALYLCEAGQMDWIDGPFVNMEKGPDGGGAKLLYKLMSHYTQPNFIYVHEWDAGDLLIYDNRMLIHAATWYDVKKYHRLMWRTTVRGNPGLEYDGEGKSWLSV